GYVFVVLSFHCAASAQSDNCVAGINPTALHFTSAGGSATVSVAATSGCVWSVSCSGAAIKSFSGLGTGGGIFSVTANSNPGPNVLTGSCAVVWGNFSQFVFVVNVSVSPPGVANWWPAIQRLLQ